MAQTLTLPWLSHGGDTILARREFRGSCPNDSAENKCGTNKSESHGKSGVEIYSSGDRHEEGCVSAAEVLGKGIPGFIESLALPLLPGCALTVLGRSGYLWKA